MNNIKSDLPIGIQTFEEIIEGKFIYVDKTEGALNLVNEFKYTFLSRPRRFGKSLFLNTLKNLFEGNKELFKGLYIYDKWNWEDKYPVIHIKFDGDLRSAESTKRAIQKILDFHQEKFNIKCGNDYNYSTCFSDLIQKVSEKYNKKVVILIDEYDKAILDNLDQEIVAKEAREILRGLYSVMKGEDEYIRFAFLTGVSKFSKASIFSGLNMIEDISLNPKYGNICGITQKELESNFKNYLIKAEKRGVNKIEIKKWYNGYNFLKNKVYNPFNILKFFANDFIFKNYWFTSGTPAFLIKLLEKQKYFLPNLSSLKVGEELLDSFDIEKIKLEIILYQAGYLTIKNRIISPRGKIQYILKYPNKEVRTSLNDHLIDYLVDEVNLDAQDNMYEDLENENIEGFINTLKGLLSGIPYNNYVKNNITHYEGYYSALVYVYLQSLGYEIIGEDTTNRGRIDLTVILDDKIYIIEFKMSTFKENPLEQIKEKKYWEKYSNSQKKIFLIGIIFDEEEKNIINWEGEKI